MSVADYIENELVKDERSVWTLPGAPRFEYSEGSAAERYLEEVLTKASDLSSTSAELDRHIKDWSSEYHLSSKRAQLLAGFTFDRSLRVLEVGCGCGAISRFLGERFDRIISVEGSIERARLARLRTRDLPNVEIVCAPFQELKLRRRFDLVVCVGVYEYSASFVRADDPYDAVLRFFRDALADDGTLLLAIENQFGLKYFNGAAEDHLGRPFAGLEGYEGGFARVRTFGRVELARNLGRCFDRVEFYYPYPDYKLPDCVLTERFLSSGAAAELVAQIRTTDRGDGYRPLWDDRLTVRELDRNGLLPHLSNSFLVVASKGAPRGISFEQLGVLYSPGRRPEFRTVTRVLEEGEGAVAVKEPLHCSGPRTNGRLTWTPCRSEWIRGESVQALVYARFHSRRLDLAEIFAPAAGWLDLLRAHARPRDGGLYVGGEWIDCTWSNVYPASGRYSITDREWVWQDELRVEVLVIRAIYTFLCQLEDAAGGPAELGVRSGRRAIRRIAEAIGVELSERDFADFVALESELQSLVFGYDRGLVVLFIRWFLLDRGTLGAFRAARRYTSKLAAAVGNRLRR